MTARTLFYWWRDYGRAEAKSRNAKASPCYLNEENALEVGFGNDALARLGPRIRAALDKLPVAAVKDLGECFAPPPEEYQFPRDLYRYG